MDRHPPRAAAPSNGGQTAFLLALVVATVVTAGLLRSFHAAVPRLPYLPGPFASPLFPALVLLSLFHIAGRRTGRDRLDPDVPGPGLTVAQVTPLLVAVLSEKWISTELLGSAYDWIDWRVGDPPMADAVFRLWTGLGLLGAALAMLPLLRQLLPWLARTVHAGRARSAAVNVAAALAIVGLALVTLSQTTGGTWILRPGRVLAVAAIAQCVRGIAEELFYRGLLQGGVTRIAMQAGFADARPAHILAVVTVSTGFTLEHFAPGVPARAWLGVFLISALLGVLLAASRNLYLPMAAHTVLNLILIGALPVPYGPGGLPLVTPLVAALLVLAMMFFGIVVAHGSKARARERKERALQS